MSRRRAVKSTRMENIKGRIGLLLAGAFALGYGFLKLHAHGPLVYFNSRGLPLYPGGVIALGIFLIVVAFVPGGKWIERLASTQQKKNFRNRRFY